ncbi:MAG: beta-ketoacyl synthase N-terminal-like domain-containing protein, partial [Pseudonocardiaceae bacterium]
MVHAERIAIVGMACRYPDAATPDELWQTVLAKRRAFRRIPESRLARGYRDPAGSPDSTYATRAAVLRDWTFDREHFGVPGPLYRAADHTHWLALETAAAALTDAGFAGGEGIDRDTAGVVLGNSLAGEFSRAGMLRLRWPFFADAAAAALQNAGAPAPLARDVLERLETLVKQPFEEPGDETLSGALANTIAGRICNHFDFHGTGYTVDGACSSSLLAVTTACRALAAGECDFLLAGGVDLSLDPLELVGFARLGALAEDDMRIYDARPTGFLPGEGCGVVALMRADDAEARGLRTYAHIVGWAMSSDGAGGLTRPELRGQTLALHRAYQAATLEPGQVRMVEGHGTGTAIGDSVELRALASVRDHDTAPAALGSIKANIGHTKAAAGAAGLIKAALAVHHRVLPPITGCDRPHEMLRGGTGPLRVLDEPEPWPDEVARAGVSSMGFGGINVHVILEGTGQASPVVLPEPARKWSVRTGPQEIVLLGADSAGALAERLSHLAGTAAMLSDAEVRDVAATAWHQRSECHSFRAALVATTPDDLASAARAASAAAGGWDGDVRFDERAGYALGSGDPVRVGLLFPGQAAPVRPELPWWARRLDVPTLPAGMASPAEPIDTAVAQPVIVHQSLAALAWFAALGCEAAAVCGHSLGEITALSWAGACGAEAAVELAVVRGQLMRRHGAGGTAMASVAATAPRVEQLLAGTDAVIACFNAPEQIVVAGPEADVATLLDRAATAGITANRLPVSHAFHSPAMDPVAEPFRRTLATASLARESHLRAVYSTITGKRLTGTAAELPGLLVDQLTSPVRFSDAVAELAARCDVLVETGPGTILAGLAEANGVGVPAVSMDAGGDPRRHAFVTALLAACAGAELQPWFADRPYRQLALDAVPRFLANPCENRRGRPDTDLPIAQPVPAAAVRPEAAIPPPSTSTDDPLRALTEQLAHRLELRASSIAPSSSLLGDLHMTSLQVVEVVGAVAAALGKEPPSAPLSLSDATLADVAEVLDGLPTATEGPAGAAAAGVRGWVRQFEVTWTPFETIPSEPSAARMDVTLPNDASPAHVAQLLTRIAAQQPARLLVVHSGHPAASGIGRSVAAELPECRVTVIETPRGNVSNPAIDYPAIDHPDRYAELRTRPDGSLERAVVRARRTTGPGDLELKLDGVCLVTGGVRGITAYAAAELAQRMACKLVFVGRSPAEDPEIVRALHDLEPARYLTCDITDQA